MMKLSRMYILLALVLLCAVGPAQANWVPLDYPGAQDTYAYGIDGENIVGGYRDVSWNNHGFLYDGLSWTTIDFPAARATSPFGIDGYSIVGAYKDGSGRYHAFVYAIPEPGTILLLGLGGLGVLRNRQSR